MHSNELIQAHAKVENALCSSTAPREGGFFATDTQFTTSHKSAKFETNGAEQPRPNSGFGIRPFEGAAAAPCDAAIIVLLLERTGQESLLLLFGPVSQSGFPRAAACQWCGWYGGRGCLGITQSLVDGGRVWRSVLSFVLESVVVRLRLVVPRRLRRENCAEVEEHWARK